MQLLDLELADLQPPDRRTVDRESSHAQPPDCEAADGGSPNRERSDRRSSPHLGTGGGGRSSLWSEEGDPASLAHPATVARLASAR